MNFKDAKSILGNKYFLPLIFIVLAFLTIYSTLIGNILYTVVNPLLFGTSVGKTAVFFLWITACLIPIKIVKIKSERKIESLVFSAFIISVLVLASATYLLADQFDKKYLAYSDAPNFGGEIHSAVRIYDNSNPIFYDSTQLHNSNLMKSAFCLLPLPKIQYDLCSPLSKLIPSEEPLLKVGLFLIFISFVLAFLFINIFQKDNFEKLKWSILLFPLVLATYDGGPLTSQFILFLSMSILFYFRDIFGTRLIALTPVALVLRNMLISTYLPTQFYVVLLFYSVPAMFIFFSKNHKQFIVGLLGALILTSLLEFVTLQPQTAETSISFYGKQIELPAPYRYVTNDGNVNVVQFKTDSLWDTYSDIFSSDRSYSFKSFYSKTERCTGTKVNVASIISDKPFNSSVINSSVIRIESSSVKNGILNIQYLCECTDCSLIPLIEARKALETDNIVQVKYILFYKKSVAEVVKDALPIPG